MATTRIYEADQFGHLIRARRTHLRWSAARLAKEAGISGAMVTQVETGKRMGSPAVLLRILDALDLEMTVGDRRDLF